MKEQFCTYDISLKLKELGFDKECLAIYTHNNEHYLAGTFFLHTPHPFTIEELTPEIQDIRESAVYILAPLWQQAIDWFREKYKINCIVGYTDDDKEEFMAVIDRPNQDIDYNMNPTESYYEAREQAILKAIELCQKE